jgi:glycosyltransferase involved in cell wall biosynthesis
LRILVLNWKDPADVDAGGAERYVQRIAELWAAQGHEVTLLVPRRGQDPSDRRAGVTYVRVGNRLTVFKKAADHLRAYGSQYDRVVECISTLPFFSHEIVGDRAIAIYLQMAKNVWDIEYRFPVGFVGRRVLEPRWARRMIGARVVALSESTRADLAEHGIACIGIAPPGSAGPSPLSRHGPLSPVPRLLFMGRLVRHKRPIDAVEAFLEIREAFPQARLDVIGDGYLRPRIEALRAPATVVHGFVTEQAKRSHLENADLLLLPATREGWGIVALEAAAHGLPVVAYDVPGLRDSVSDGVTGILCRPRPEAMAQAATAVLRDSGRWQALSDAGPPWAAQFTWEQAAATIMDLMAVAG